MLSLFVGCGGGGGGGGVQVTVVSPQGVPELAELRAKKVTEDRLAAIDDALGQLRAGGGDGGSIGFSSARSRGFASAASLAAGGAASARGSVMSTQSTVRSVTRADVEEEVARARTEVGGGAVAARADISKVRA